jgi:ABC-type nitrate/sulfonate/bicarbonate transport system substrate-binding protein
MARVTDFIAQLGVPETPFILYVADMNYAAAHPDNVKAFLAAYRESVKALQTDDDLWTERAKELNVTDPAVVAALRDGSRPMLMSAFTPASEANIRKTWDILVATAGADTLGMSDLVDGFMTRDYQ